MISVHSTISDTTLISPGMLGPTPPPAPAVTPVPPSLSPRSQSAGAASSRAASAGAASAGAVSARAPSAGAPSAGAESGSRWSRRTGATSVAGGSVSGKGKDGAASVKVGMLLFLIMSLSQLIQLPELVRQSGPYHNLYQTSVFNFCMPSEQEVVSVHLNPQQSRVRDYAPSVT